MKPNWLAVVIAFLLGIGITYLVISPRGSSTSDRTNPSGGIDTLHPLHPFTVEGQPNKNPNALDKSFLPIDTGTASEYVRNFKNIYPRGTFAFTIYDNTIKRFFENTNCQGIRVYLGIRDPRTIGSGKIIITGVNGRGGDLYLTEIGGEVAINQSTPCPDDCPWEQDQYTPTDARADTSRDMLGRLPSDPLKKPIKP